jgi:hypothetical protein
VFDYRPQIAETYRAITALASNSHFEKAYLTSRAAAA